MIPSEMYAQMQANDYRSTPRDYHEWLTALSQTEQAWQRIKDDLTARLAVLRAKPETTRFDHQEMNALTEDLRHCEHGWNPSDGASDARIVALPGQPGLERIAVLRAKVQREIEELEAMQQGRGTWPRLFSYTGAPGRAVIDGKRLQPGNVVLLNEHQATAFSDRFTECAQEEEESAESAQKSDLNTVS